jgi:peptidoglycan/LPS O-acetylase OafA/YrhL
LRAVAVVPVVLYHAGVPGISGGFLGVDVFFVISGFLITSIVAGEIAEGRFSLISFYERRARRIVPALTVVVLSTFTVGWFFLLPGEYKYLGQSALAAALFLSNLYFTLKLDYFAPAAEFAPLLHTWSLAVEEQFYLFYPPMLALLFAWRGLKAALWAVVGLSGLSLVAALALLPIKPDWVFYLIFFRAWELGVGALLALFIFPTPRHFLLREFIGIIGLLAILVPVFLYNANTPFPGLAALPPVLGTAAIIYVGTNGLNSTVNKVLAHRSLVWLGLISYSLYLWHWPILAFLRIGLGGASLPMIVSLTALTVSVVIAWVSYRFIERPFRAQPPVGFTRGAIFSLSATVLFAMVVIGGLLHLTTGLPGRLPAHVAAISAVVQTQNDHRRECFARFPEEDLCTVGAQIVTGEPVNFLFWGDSHAEALLPVMDLTAHAAGQSGLFVGIHACPPIRQVRSLPGNRGCTRMNQSVRDFLEERTDISLVILSARWALSIEGTRYRQEAGRPRSLEWSGDEDARPERADNASLVEAGLMSTVEELLASGREVVILGQIPEVGWDVPTVLARGEMLGWSLPPSLTEADFWERAGRTEEILLRVASTHNDVRYLRISDVLCTSGECSIVGEDGLPLYVDDNHISTQAAVSLLSDRLTEIWINEVP